jgi:MFS transporter, SP family, general alpha glucoside:H+ symporter
MADFFETAGLSDSLLGSVIVSCAGLAAAFASFFLIETKKVGRWPLVFWGVVGITISMCEFCFYFSGVQL